MRTQQVRFHLQEKAEEFAAAVAFARAQAFQRYQCEPSDIPGRIFAARVGTNVVATVGITDHDQTLPLEPLYNLESAQFPCDWHSASVVKLSWFFSSMKGCFMNLLLVALKHCRQSGKRYGILQMKDVVSSMLKTKGLHLLPINGAVLRIDKISTADRAYYQDASPVRLYYLDINENIDSIQNDINSALYPHILPYRTHYLNVDDVHTLYIEESGNPDGLPVVYCHGGPGFGCDADNRRYFNPEIYRIILFDQRGAGKSTPFAEIKNNDTQALVSDMETIRKHLGIEAWVVFGGSWGSTLGLVYAETVPERVLALIVRGIFLGRYDDIQWFFNGGGAQHVFPDHWRNFYEFIPQEERHDILTAYYNRLTCKDAIINLKAALAWVTWQATCAMLRPSAALLSYVQDPNVALSAALLEAHYYSNKCFLSPNQILENAHRLNHIPITIIHGRYDMIFNVKNAWDLHLALPGSTLEIIADGGHAAIDPPVTKALVNATNTIAQMVQCRIMQDVHSPF